ncbi:pseudouridine synthase [Ochromonadaceae sp. CCMP2298]|nr:pseudouridine synthase [Ochromonadaceae sp. CCMP2298]
MFVVCLLLLTFAVGLQAFSPPRLMGPKSWTISHTNLHSGKDYELLVPSDAKKCRLDVFLSDTLQQHTRSFVANLCDEGLVIVNDKKQSKSYKVSKGDIISFSVEDREITSVEPEDIPLDIIYEDEQMIAVNKPVGMVVHPAVGSPNGTFVNALLYHLGEERATKLFEEGVDKTGSAMDDDEGVDLPETPEAATATPVFLRPGIVHRLDKGTSGVLLAGKTSEAVSKISKLFAMREVRKVYLAVCVGHPGETTILSPIGRSVKNRQLMCTYEGAPGKPAVTHIRTLCFDGKLSVCLVRIETGRTHQIRVHLKDRRTPIVGDEAYGNADWNKKLLKSNQIRRPLLHAYETVFVHPFTGEELTINAPVPPDMAQLIRKLSAERTALFTDDQTHIIDPETSLLVGSTDVAGEVDRGYIMGGMNAMKNGRTEGFVPMDRVLLNENPNEWLLQDLPETGEYLAASGLTRRARTDL